MSMVTEYMKVWYVPSAIHGWCINQYHNKFPCISVLPNFFQFPCTFEKFKKERWNYKKIADQGAPTSIIEYMHLDFPMSLQTRPVSIGHVLCRSNNLHIKSDLRLISFSYYECHSLGTLITFITISVINISWNWCYGLAHNFTFFIHLMNFLQSITIKVLSHTIHS